MKSKIRHSSLILHQFLSVFVSLWICGCGQREAQREDMAIQPKYQTYQPSDYFIDGASARPLMAGVVPRDPGTVPGIIYNGIRSPGPALAVHRATTESIPFPITRTVLQEGQTQYNIYCAVCHGRLGNGEGMIVQRGFSRPPSFHIDRLRQVPDSHLYNVISNGFGAMFSYADRVLPHQRWQIVAYIRALQEAADTVELPADSPIRRALTGQGDRKTPEGGGP